MTLIEECIEGFHQRSPVRIRKVAEDKHRTPLLKRHAEYIHSFGVSLKLVSSALRNTEVRSESNSRELQ